MGRRPKADAIRRSAPRGQSPAVIIDGLAMPDEVAGNELMRDCWEWTVNGSSHFTQAHIPQLVAYCAWWATARQCIENIGAPNGGIVTKVDTPMGPRQDPDIRTLQLATNQLRTLAAELGISPLAQTRMGLMKVATASMAVDLPAKVFKMLDEHYGD